MSEELEQSLGYTFKTKELLRNALIHKSYNEGVQKGNPDNEKLEFLGDSVINLVITDYLYRHFTEANEGELARLKAHLVSSNVLCQIALSIGLNHYLLLGKGEEKNNGRANRKINASLLEAIVGAIYLDSNYKTVSEKMISFFRKFLEKFTHKDVRINDYKSELQEVIQRDRNVLPQYKILGENGKPPNVTFRAAVYLDDSIIGRGFGRNKREAEQDAAFNALKDKEEFINYEKLSEVFFIRNPQ